MSWFLKKSLMEPRLGLIFSRAVCKSTFRSLMNKKVVLSEVYRDYVECIEIMFLSK